MIKLIIFLSFLFLAPSFPVNETCPVSDGDTAKHYLGWHLDKDEDPVRDSSGNSVDGDVTDAAYNSSGKFGGCYYFDDDNDYIDTESSITWGDDVSYSFWLYPTGFSSYNTCVFSNATEQCIYIWNSANGIMQVYIYAGGWKIISATEATPLNEWNFVVVTYVRNSYMRAYINGVELDNSPTAVVDIAIANGVVRIGNHYNLADDYLGYIDDFFVWKKALTFEEQEALHREQIKRHR